MSDKRPKNKVIAKKNKNLKNNDVLEPIEIMSDIDEKVENYTRNEWKSCKNLLKTGGEDVKLHSKRVRKC